MIAYSGCTNDTSTLTTDTTPTTSTGYYECFIPWNAEEVDEDEYLKKVRPPSYKPAKGTFRISRGSFKGIAKSAKRKNFKINKKRRWQK